MLRSYVSLLETFSGGKLTRENLENILRSGYYLTFLSIVFFVFGFGAIVILVKSLANAHSRKVSSST